MAASGVMRRSTNLPNCAGSPSRPSRITILSSDVPFAILSPRHAPMNAPVVHPPVSEAVTRFLARRHQAFINGKWVDAESGKTFETFDPGSGRVIAQVAECEA